VVSVIGRSLWHQKFNHIVSKIQRKFEVAVSRNSTAAQFFETRRNLWFPKTQQKSSFPKSNKIVGFGNLSKPLVSEIQRKLKFPKLGPIRFLSCLLFAWRYAYRLSYLCIRIHSSTIKGTEIRQLISWISETSKRGGNSSRRIAKWPLHSL
jgi:hypothetical protein